MCCLDRVRKKKYKEKDKKRCGVARTDEVRKWDEGPSGEVEGNGDPHCRGFSQNQTDRPLRLVKQTVRRYRNRSDSSVSSLVRVEDSR